MFRKSVLKLFVAMEEQLLITAEVDGGWRTATKLLDTKPQCLAVDSFTPSVLYCGTFGQGLWRTNDSGENWCRVGKGVLPAQITSVAVSQTEKAEADKLGVVYMGTEPSMLYRSADGGETWQKPSELTDLPSARTWSFPPRP